MTPGGRFILALALAALAVPAASAQSVPDLEHAIYKAEALAPWLRAAALSRADLVGIGDSNQIHSADGWDQGVSKAHYTRFGQYATGLISAGENRGSGAGMGYGYTGVSTLSSGQFAYTGAPAPLDAALAANAGMEPLNYLYVPAGQTITNELNTGLILLATSPLDTSANLSFRAVFGAFPEVRGTRFTLNAREASGAFQTLSVSKPFSTAADQFSIFAATLDLPAAPRGALNTRVNAYGEPITGPFIWYYIRAENTERPAGTSVHTLYAFGLRTAYDMGLALRTADDAYLTLYFSEVRALQGSAPRVLIRVNTGVNDRNESRPSLGTPPTLPGNSPQAFADNLRAIIDRITSIWTLNNWDLAELFFLITPTHPIAAPDDAQLIAYRAAADTVADTYPRVAVGHLDRLITAPQILSNFWYPLAGFDRNHLLASGYEALSALELQALEHRAGCWRDPSGDQAIDPEDLYSDQPAATIGICLVRAIRSFETADTLSERLPDPPR